MRTPILVSALCVLILAAPASSRAADPAVATRIGPVSLSLPSPDGFTEPSVLVPQLRQIGETMTPPTNRLLALFVSDGDVKLAVSGKEPELTRYFMVQTLRKTEANVVTTNEFLRLRNLLRGQYQELLSRVAPRVQGHLDSAARSIGKDSGIPDLSLRVGELRAVEIFDDRSTSISLLALTKYTVQVAGKVEEVPITMGSTTAIVKGKLVYFYAYSRYRSSADLDWIRSQTKMWLPRLTGGN